MTALPSTREVCLHEAYHCASLILDGLTPLSVAVNVWDAPDGRLGGVRSDWDSHDFTTRNMRAKLVSTLLGPMADGEEQVDIGCWPIVPADWQPGNVPDAKQIKFLCQWLQYDQISWGYALHLARRRTHDPRFGRLAMATAHALQESGELLKPELEAIAREVT